MVRMLAAVLAALLAVPAAAEGPAVWRVADADTTIYLFGTFHALPADIDWYRGPVVRAFEAADELVLEAGDPAEDEGDPFAEAMMLPEGKSLRARLPQPLRQRFDSVVARRRLPTIMVDRLKPWAAAFLIAGVEGGGRVYRAEHGVETVLTGRAEAAGMPVGELEGVAAQLAIFDGIPSPVQIRFLADTLENAADPEATAREDRILTAWAAGDTATFASESRDFVEEPMLRTALLDRRNDNWADWIVDRLKRPGTVLVAVGAAHLNGDDSVQAHLERRGIAAARVAAAEIAPKPAGGQGSRP